MPRCTKILGNREANVRYVDCSYAGRASERIATRAERPGRIAQTAACSTALIRPCERGFFVCDLHPGRRAGVATRSSPPALLPEPRPLHVTGIDAGLAEIEHAAPGRRQGHGRLSGAVIVCRRRARRRGIVRVMLAVTPTLHQRLR